MSVSVTVCAPVCVCVCLCQSALLQGFYDVISDLAKMSVFSPASSLTYTVYAAKYALSYFTPTVEATSYL